jgi:hypothetical protein
MPNPFEFVSFVRALGEDLEQMNAELCARLDKIIGLLEEIRDNTGRIPDDPF